MENVEMLYMQEMSTALQWKVNVTKLDTGPEYAETTS